MDFDLLERRFQVDGSEVKLSVRSSADDPIFARKQQNSFEVESIRDAIDRKKGLHRKEHHPVLSGVVNQKSKIVDHRFDAGRFEVEALASESIHFWKRKFFDDLLGGGDDVSVLWVHG